MSTAHYLLGDTRDVVDRLPPESIDLVLTSPPFLALRSYLPADHPHKDAEIGSEDTPAAFLDVLLDLTARWARVLAPGGSIAIELGDTYSGSGGSGGDYRDGHLREGQALWSGSAAKRRSAGAGDNDRPARSGRNGNTLDHARKDRWAGSDDRPGWPLAKCLTMVPELYRVALAYGINPLTGEPSPAGRWRIRNVVRWHRPNPPVGALADKYRPATSDMVIATRDPKRWFDLDAVRYQAQEQGFVPSNGPKSDQREAEGIDGAGRYAARIDSNPAGAPPLDTWVIPTHPYKGAHYATWPPALCEKPIKSMVPLEVCRACGTPRQRVTTAPEYINGSGEVVPAQQWGSGVADGEGAHSKKPDGHTTRRSQTIGWTECDCPTPDYRPGVVLDPFAGTGTTLAVATGHGRHAIGIDIDERNLDLARDRVGPLVLTEGDELPDWLPRTTP